MMFVMHKRRFPLLSDRPAAYYYLASHRTLPPLVCSKLHSVHCLSHKSENNFSRSFDSTNTAVILTFDFSIATTKPHVRVKLLHHYSSSFRQINLANCIGANLQDASQK